MGAGILQLALAIAVGIAALELLLLRRFQGSSFWLSPSLRSSVIAAGAPPERCVGQVAASPSGLLRLCSTRESRAVASGSGGVDRIFPAVASLRHHADGTLVRLRIGLGSPAAIAVSALLCGHLAGKANPFGQGAWTAESVLPAALALALLATLWVGVRRARRRLAALEAGLGDLFERAAVEDRGTP